MFSSPCQSDLGRRLFPSPPSLASVWEKTNNYQAGILSRATRSEGAAAESPEPPGQVRLLRRPVSRRGSAARPQRGAALISAPLQRGAALISAQSLPQPALISAFVCRSPRETGSRKALFLVFCPREVKGKDKDTFSG